MDTIKNKMNLIVKHFNTLCFFLSTFSLSFSFLISKILFSDKDNFFTIILITEEMIVEYSICGMWYKKLKAPWSSYILCIVESLKNNALTVKYNEKL